jgi:formylglycine-generating enzyme required for sulfatase activity
MEILQGIEPSAVGKPAQRPAARRTTGVSGQAQAARNRPRRSAAKGLPMLGWVAVAVLGLVILAGAVAFFWKRPAEGTGNEALQAALSGPAESTQRAASLPARWTNRLGMELVLVPKGTSWLGSGNGKPGDRKVEIPYDFYLGKYEVTQEEWQKITGLNPSTFKAGHPALAGVSEEDRRRFPVESISWDDAQTFLERVNAGAQEPGWVYRLPTRTEWEYACRGGPLKERVESAFDYYLDQPTDRLLPQQANFKESQLLRPCKVGSYPPNRLGLYDMHGNVQEWYADEEKTPKGLLARTFGGGWQNDARHCRAAYHSINQPTSRTRYRGLRLARVPADHGSP